MSKDKDLHLTIPEGCLPMVLALVGVDCKEAQRPKPQPLGFCYS